jgi:hypothetical protein
LVAATPFFSFSYVKGKCSEGCLYIFRAGDFTFGHSCRSPDAEQTRFDLFVLYFLVWISGLVMLCTMLKVTYDSVRGGRLFFLLFLGIHSLWFVLKVNFFFFFFCHEFVYLCPLLFWQKMIPEQKKKEVTKLLDFD